MGVELYEWLRPEPLRLIDGVDPVFQSLGANAGERAGECLVLADYGFIKIEDVHPVDPFLSDGRQRDFCQAYFAAS